MQGNLFGILFIGLLADLPAILDSFFNNTTSDFIGVVGSHKVAGKNTHQVVTPPYGPIGAIDSPKSSQICVLKWCMYKTPSCKSGHILCMQ